MSSAPPFVDLESGTLQLGQIRNEALPILGLVVLFAGLALIPFVFVVAFAPGAGIGLFLTVVAQLILAVGGAIVLMYVVARGIQLSET